MNSQRICRSKTAFLAVRFALVLQLGGGLAVAQSIPTMLNIVVVQGDGAMGQVGRRASHDPIVRIVDEKQSPVSGAAVVFTLPTEGASGSFANGSKTLTVVTDAAGVATAKGLRFNGIPGKVPIHLNASYKGLGANASMMLITEAPAGYKAKNGGRGHGKLVAVVLVLAGGAAASGAVLATRSSNPSTPSSIPAPPAAIGITPGTGTLTPPR